jgi:hypothetical protein
MIPPFARSTSACTASAPPPSALILAARLSASAALPA